VTLFQDLQYSTRLMRRAPWFTAAAVATLALGLGLNSAVLSLVNSLFYKGLPLDDAARLVEINQFRKGQSEPAETSLSYPDYVYFREQTRTLADLAAHYPTSPMQVSTSSEGIAVLGSVVTSNYFALLRVSPELGQFFRAEDDQTPGRNAVAVISYNLWRRLGADPAIVGTALRINGTSFTVIGVAPQDFPGIVRGVPPSEVWIPTSMFAAGYRYCNGLERGCSVLHLIGRLQQGVDIATAQTDLSLLARQLEASFPETNKDVGVRVRAARGVRNVEQARSAPIVKLLAVASALVLLAASANVAGLLVARGLRRRQEIAIRLALGASRRRIIRQLLIEAMTMSALGGLAGLLVAVWAMDLARRFFAVAYAGTVLNMDLSLDWRIVLAGIVVALVTGAFTGILPALQSTRPQLLPVLRDQTAGAGTRRTKLREGLIVVQVAVAVVLLVCSALLIRSFLRVRAGTGFDPAGIVVLRIRPSLVGYDTARAWVLQREAIRRVDALSGVISASPAGIPALPGWGEGSEPVFRADEQADPEHALDVPIVHVGPRYFETLGTKLRQGREFDSRDLPAGAPVAILNETLARRLWPDGAALGNTITIGERTHLVIGIAPDLQLLNTRQQAEPVVYLDHWQRDRTRNQSKDAQLHVRVAGDPHLMLEQIRKEIVALDRDVPITETLTLSEGLSDSFANVRAARALLLTFGLLALLLCAIGLYAALSFSITQRTREIAIRMALGAPPARLGGLVLGQGASLVVLGTGLGLFCGVLAGPLLGSFLYGVSPRDPLALLAGPGLLFGVSIVATWLPVRRTMRLDPMITLRRD
jgi:putative ABC transport system permease protein